MAGYSGSRFAKIADFSAPGRLIAHERCAAEDGITFRRTPGAPYSMRGEKVVFFDGDKKRKYGRARCRPHYQCAMRAMRTCAFAPPAPKMSERRPLIFSRHGAPTRVRTITSRQNIRPARGGREITHMRKAGRACATIFNGANIVEAR